MRYDLSQFLEVAKRNDQVLAQLAIALRNQGAACEVVLRVDGVLMDNCINIESDRVWCGVFGVSESFRQDKKTGRWPVDRIGAFVRKLARRRKEDLGKDSTAGMITPREPWELTE